MLEDQAAEGAILVEIVISEFMDRAAIEEILGHRDAHIAGITRESNVRVSRITAENVLKHLES